jgi:hypothetical protein
MKAKNTSHQRPRKLRNEETLPHELGRHLFAMIRRNLLNRQKPQSTTADQLTFAF